MKTRFAPSPTGYLHRGHVWSALQVWDAAQRYGASVHLRIEDHDSKRCRPEYTDSILEDLAWLGFHWDEESRQSERGAVYAEALATLAAKGLVYGCSCTRSLIQSDGRLSSTGEAIYCGRCRDAGLPLDGNIVRVRVPDDLVVCWHDERLGEFADRVAGQCGDFVLRDKAGQWSYQFAATVDDFVQGVDLIVRGEDLLSSTARQIWLSQQLGRTQMPVFIHHSLLNDATGAKLSKRNHAASIRAEREAGISAEEMIHTVRQKRMYLEGNEIPNSKQMKREKDTTK